MALEEIPSKQERKEEGADDGEDYAAHGAGGNALGGHVGAGYTCRGHACCGLEIKY